MLAVIQADRPVAPPIPRKVQFLTTVVFNCLWFAQLGFGTIKENNGLLCCSLPFHDTGNSWEARSERKSLKFSGKVKEKCAVEKQSD